MKSVRMTSVFDMDLRLLLRTFLLSTLSLSLGIGLARAQGEFGTVVGTVTDPTGASVPGATVKASNEATTFGFSTVSGQPEIT